MTKIRSPDLKSLCVFCGSSLGADPTHREAAGRLGGMLAKEGITLIFGGGHLGMMGMLSDAVLRGGGRAVGVIPDHLLRIEAPSRELTELIVVDGMHTRKRRMFDMADAFCVLPGGTGTLDETFEILTWKQLRLHNKPIILANLRGYWNPWVDMLDAIVAGGFARADTLRLFTVVDSVDDVLPTVRRELGAALVGEPRLF